MNVRSLGGVGVALGIILLAGCPGRKDVQCGEDLHCDLGPGGTCLAASTGNSWCAYPDPGCPSGYRYSDLDVGDGVSGECVMETCDPQSGSGCPMVCTPSMAVSCTDDQLTSCNADGTGMVIDTCALGCADSEPRCLTFEPSNGLGPALAESANEPDITLPPGTRIDTDLGLIQDANGTALPVKSAQVNQAGGMPIRVFQARSFNASDVTVTGTIPLAFVASGPITFTGRLTVRASGPTAGPGAQSSAACNGVDKKQYECICTNLCSAGAGGAGNYQAGGLGGAAFETAGGALTGFSPLAGGCSGGSQRSLNGAVILAPGGGGGGAVQIVSLTRIVLTDQGLIDVGGGGGQSTAGGGSGGLVIFEAPEISFVGPASGVVANGGAGGGCGMTGPDATTTTSPAPGAVCANYFAGRGGTASNSPGNGCVIGVDTCTASCQVAYGGGGGSVGRMRLATKDGTFEASGGPLVSVHVVTAILSLQ